ncbi:MAG TPA: glycoside hydrolase family 57 protein [Chloroflexota bacterium]|nr:glycoside hydrolase family 57 protein [Chloroflexota bacterium]
MPAPLNVAFVWHMHQPYYRDQLTGEYMLPWVLLHGTKDYLHMANVLEQFPRLHMTFNLVPCLAQQILDYAGGEASGLFMRVCATPPDELTDDDKRYILDFFFSINYDKVIARYPRYQQLFHESHSPDEHPREFWADTIGWFNMAWMDPTLIASDPELAALTQREHFSDADLTCIRQKQRDVLRSILPTYRRMLQTGQIELSTSPYYHPVLPLLIDNHAAAHESAPYVSLPAIRYRHPEDAVEQVRRARAAHRELFGSPPAGLWPSEGGVSQAIVYPLAQSGVRWIASDEEILNRSRGWSSRTHDGAVWDPDSLYSAYCVRDEDFSLAMVFRDRGLSDEIGFKYQNWQPHDAANDLMARLHGIRDALGDTTGEHIVPLILDGENCWEFYDNNGQDFLEALYTKLSEDETLRCVTVSEFLDEHPPSRTLDHLASGSWIGGTFDVWIGELAQNIAWDYLARTRDDLVRWETECEGAELEVLERAWEEIYIAEGSDWFWWYYSGNDPNLERGFDHQFRQHLINVYTLMGSPVPDYLAEPILKM